MPSVSHGQNSYVSTFEKLKVQNTLAPRPILIQISAPWCAVCKIQQRKIEKDNSLKAVLAKSYYYIELDAECKDDITFNGQLYSFIPHGTTGGVHGLAVHLDPAGAYPAWILISPDYKMLYRYNGLLQPDQLKEFLTK